MDPRKKSILTETEQNGLKKMKILNKTFVVTKEASEEVLDFMTKAGQDEALMLRYLIGRKNRPEHAWETLKRYAEVRFDKYPEVYTSKPASFHNHFQDIGLWGVLKNKDKLGRTVICVMGNKWNTSEFDMVELTNGFVNLINQLLLDEDVLKNGVVVVENCEEMGLGYAKHYGLHDMLRTVNVLWYACPLKVKNVYFVNVHYGLTFLYTLITPFLSNKFKERLSVTTSNKKFDALHFNVDQDILPKSLGGKLEHDEAFELIKYRS